MRRVLWVLTVLILLPINAKAIDIATEHTQLLNYAQLLLSLENQIKMIQNQIEELKSVANYRNNFNDADSLRNELTNITSQGTSLSNQTQAILAQMDQELANWPSGGTMLDGQEASNQSALTVIQNTLNRVAQLRASYQHEIDSLNALMSKNDQAVGQTQALQTSNQIAAQNIAQNQGTQELLSEQISLQAVMMGKQLQEEQDKDEKMKQIFNDADDPNGASITDN